MMSDIEEIELILKDKPNYPRVTTHGYYLQDMENYRSKSLEWVAEVVKLLLEIELRRLKSNA